MLADGVFIKNYRLLKLAVTGQPMTQSEEIGEVLRKGDNLLPELPFFGVDQSGGKYFAVRV